MLIRISYFILSSALILLSPKKSFCQKAEDFIGDWKVIKVELSSNADEEEKQNVEATRKILLKSIFHFKANNSFSLDAPDKDLAVKDGVWKFDSDKKYINVTERPSVKSPGQLMGITVRAENDNYLFLLDETPVILTVSKK